LASSATGYVLLVRVWGGAVAAIIGVALAPAASAQPSSFVIQGDYKIGGYAVKKDGTLFGAIEEFGEPTSIRRGRYRGRVSGTCVVRWRNLGLRIIFYNLGGQDPCVPQYGFFREALLTGPRWTTTKRVRIGDPMHELYNRYRPRRFGGAWVWLVVRYSPIGLGGYYAGLEAKGAKRRFSKHFPRPRRCHPGLWL
jgi:hypothetical protein